MPGTSFRTWTRENWQSVVFYLVCIALIVAAVLYTRPFQLEDLIEQELEGTSDISQALISAMGRSGSRSIATTFNTTDTQEIAAVLEYLKGIRIRRPLIAPDYFYGSEEGYDSYIILLNDLDGNHVGIYLVTGAIKVDYPRKKNKTYLVLEPDNFLDFYDIIKDFPQQ